MILRHSVVNNLQLFYEKRWGNLVKPSQVIYKIICESEIFKIYAGDIKCNKLCNIMVLKTIENLGPLNFNDPSNHLYIRDGIDTHIYTIYKTVINIFTKIRMFHFVKL